MTRAALLVLVTAWGALVLAGAATARPELMLAAVLVLYAGVLAWALAAPVRRYLVALFLGPFGLFLLSRPVLRELGLVDPRVNADLLPWSTHTRVHVLLLLTLSLLALAVGALGAERVLGFSVRRGEQPPGERRLAAHTRLVALWLLVPLLAARVLVTVERARQVQSGGFYSLYTEFTSSLPTPVLLASDALDAVVLTLLATRPGRRLTWAVLLVYLGVGALQLATLQRAGFFLNLLVVGFYLCLRHYTRPVGERPWITVTPVLTTLACLPLLMLASNAVGEARGRNSPSADGPLAGILDFVYDQGVTVNVLAFTDQLAGRLPQDRLYSLGPVLEFVRYRLAGVFTGESLVAGNAVERYTEGHQLSHVVSYVVMPDLYLSGSGYGSTYVAELYLDGGLVGVVVGSLLLGALLGQLPRLLDQHLVVCAIGLVLVRELFFVTRGSYSGFLVGALGLPNLLAATVLVGGAAVLSAWSARTRAPA